MRRGFIVKTATAFFISILAFSFSAHARIVDKVVAVVNDEIITQSEVDRLLYPIYMQYSQIYKTEEELYKKLDEARLEILKQLINDKLILCEAKRLQIAVDEKEINEQIDFIKNDLKNKGVDFETLLNEQNLTLAELKEKYREQILVKKTIDRELRSRIDIQPSEVSNYYNTHIEDYTQPEQVAVYGILIKLESVRTPLESLQLAADVRKIIDEGRDFNQAADEYSEGPNKEQGGDLGYAKRGELLKEIENVIFFLKTGEVSDVIETPIGYHIFKVYDRKEENVMLFEEARQKVTESLYQAKLQKQFEDWIEKLKSKAYLSIK